MSSERVIIPSSGPLKGSLQLVGAKNAVLVIMASLILAQGRSKLTNVPASDDVLQMIELLKSLGAQVVFDAAANELVVDTADMHDFRVSPDIMKKMRASILVMGPLLARFLRAQVALPGGCLLGARPIDFHLKAFAKMGATIECTENALLAHASELRPGTFVLDYPSVGATENIMMASVLTRGKTRIINAAIEPEVVDLIEVLKKMGAQITLLAPATIDIQGVERLSPIEHMIMYDRLEAGTLLLAAAVTGGELELHQAPADSMQVFLAKLEEMGHQVITQEGKGVTLKATDSPKAVSFKTMPYPGFPTDLQAPMMAALCLASGTSIIQETVFENRLLHCRELQKMGAHVWVLGDTATVKGVDQLYGCQVIATDIRASAALLIAGLVAQGTTSMTGVHHLKRGYQGIVEKLNSIGAHISFE